MHEMKPKYDVVTKYEVKRKHRFQEHVHFGNGLFIMYSNNICTKIKLVKNSWRKLVFWDCLLVLVSLKETQIDIV